MDSIIRLVQALGTWGWIVVMVIGICIVVAVAVSVVFIRIERFEHEERMAKINAGIDPADEVDACKKDEV